MEKPISTPTSARHSSTGDASVPGGSPRNGSQSTSARAQPRTVLSDRYHLGEELGRGAFGLVFKGVDTRTGGAVAIKQLSLAGISAETLQSIMGEIELLRNLNHKNIVKYIGSFKTRTHLYIILEYMDRGAISSVIQPSQFGAFPESLVAVYIAQVLQGLAYLHDQGVVHRDIKGANILTTSEGLVKLADFGVAARLSELEADRDKSRISVVGTPYWMAPEVIEMTSTTPASDIWSVACLAVELLTGQPPYFHLLPMAALFRIVQDEKPELPSKMSADMHDFLHQCFQKDPQRRPTARELLKHRWITYNRRTLRSSWSRTQGAKAMGGQRMDAHKSVSKVVEQILQAEADEFAASAAAATAGKPLPSQPEGSSRAGAPQQIPMNQSRGVLSDQGSRGGSLDALALELHAADKQEAVATAPAAADGGALPAGGMATLERGTSGEEPLPRQHSRGSSRANSLAAGQLPPPGVTAGGGGLLDGMLRVEGPAQREAGENLLAWLELKEQNQVGGSAPPEQGGVLLPEDILQGGINKHQEAAEVRRLVGIWRSAYGRETGSGSPGRDRGEAAIEAGQALLRMCREESGHVETFLAEDGGLVLVELLQDPCSEKVAIHALQMLNELVALDFKALGATALLSGVPAVARYAGRGVGHVRSQDTRLQAAYFLQFLAHTSLLTAQLLVTCQGLPVLVGLVEPDFEEHGPLVHIGVNSIWRLLELHGAAAMNRICRLLATHGVAHNLVHALRSAILYTKDPKKQGRGKAGRANGVARQGSASDSQRPETSPSQPQPSLRTPREGDQEAGSTVRAVEARARLYKYPGSYESLDSTEGLHLLLDKMAALLLLLSHADTAVKATLCRQDTLKTLFRAIEYCPHHLQLTVLKAVKQLTSDPSMLEALQDAGTIESLGQYLKVSWSLPIQVEALHALHNLCKISRQRQEAAANAGLVPYLMNLAQMSPEHAEADPLQEQLRQMAISLLCGMVHSTWNTRMALWNCNGLTTLLELLKEEDWQGPALDALAAWLVEDMNRIEGRLSQSVAKFVQLFNIYRTRGGSDALARLLDPFLRILRRSPQITIEVALAGLAGIVVEMLKTASALTALSLLQMVKIIYEHHPRPKEFVSKYAITDQLRQLSRQHGPNSSVLVNKQATHLLHAFQINSIF